MSGMLRFLLFVCFACAAGIGVAQDIRTEAVRFPVGASGTTIDGSITGYESVSYMLGAEAGQRMVVKLVPSNFATYFNVYAPGRGPGDEAIANSGMTGANVPESNAFDGTLEATGDYTISVYMMRAAARRNEKSAYSLEISVTGNAEKASESASRDPGASFDERVRFAAGTTGAETSGTLAPGQSRRYILGASSGQDLYVRIAPDGAGFSYQVFNPDSTFLLNMVSAEQEYRGELWQSGDHVVEVINRGDAAHSYTVIIGIE